MPPELQELLDRLSELTTEELADLEARIRTEAQTRQDGDVTDESLEELGALSDGLDAVSAEATRRVEELSSLTRTTASRPTPGAIQRRGGGRPVVAPLVSAELTPTTVLTADGREQIDSSRGIVEQLIRAWDQSRNDRPMKDGRRYNAVKVRAEYPDERVLSRDAVVSLARIQAATSPEAIVAAGGLCAPVTPRYELMDTAVAERPVRDALAGFQADRGGITFIAPPTLDDLDGAVTVWSVTNDEIPGSDGPAEKACLTVDCGEVVEVNVAAISRCLGFGNMGARAYPEQVATFISKAIAVQAREAEERLLSLIAAGSTVTTAASDQMSATRDLLASLGRAAAATRHRNRTNSTMPLRVILPDWTRELIRADLLRQMPGDQSMAVADAQITEFLSRRNLNVSWTIDGPGFAAQGAGALAAWPGSVRAYVFPEGSWLFLDGGELDLGIVRDSALNATNDFQVFAETFEAAAYLGDVQSLVVDMNICPSGESSGTVDFAGCITGS